MMATLTTKGQITVPREVRRRLNLRPGDRLDFRIAPDGRVSVEPAQRRVRELFGILHRPGRKPVAVEDMNRARDRYLQRKYSR
jgi:antitoxin PrlF